MPRRLKIYTGKRCYGYPHGYPYEMNTNLKGKLMKLVKRKKPKINLIILSVRYNKGKDKKPFWRTAYAFNKN